MLESREKVLNEWSVLLELDILLAWYWTAVFGPALYISTYRGGVVNWNDNTYYFKPHNFRVKPVTASSMLGLVN